MLIEQEVVIPEVEAAHVPVEVLRLDIQCEHVSQQSRERGRDFFY